MEHPPSSHPPVLDYATPDTNPPPAFSIRVCVIVSLIVLTSSVLNLQLIPRIEPILKDFNVQLPTITSAVFWIARHDVWIIFWIFPPVMGVVPRLLYRRIASLSTRRTIQYILIMFILVLTLLLPLFLLLASYYQLISAVAK